MNTKHEDEIEELEERIAVLEEHASELREKVKELRTQAEADRGLMMALLEELGLSPLESKMALTSNDPRSRILSMIRESISDHVCGVSYIGES